MGSSVRVNTLNLKSLKADKDQCGASVEFLANKAIESHYASAPKPKKEAKAVAVRFTPPEYLEVFAYFESKGAGSGEPTKFMDFYTSKGWMVGKTKMKDWKAAARNWISRNHVVPAQGAERSTRDMSIDEQLNDKSWAK